MMTRDQQFERELERMISRAPKDMDLKPVLTSMFRMVGKEIDRIEKNATSEVSPAPASGGTVIVNGTTIVTTAGVAPVGVIAIIQQAVVSGANTISFTSPLSNAVYGGFLVLSDSEGMLLDSAELRMRATAMTKNNFVYTASGAGTLYGFAVVTA